VIRHPEVAANGSGQKGDGIEPTRVPIAAQARQRRKNPYARLVDPSDFSAD
jgi:hypothetical protein